MNDYQTSVHAVSYTYIYIIYFFYTGISYIVEPCLNKSASVPYIWFLSLVTLLFLNRKRTIQSVIRSNDFRTSTRLRKQQSHSMTFSVSTHLTVWFFLSSCNYYLYYLLVCPSSLCGYFYQLTDGQSCVIGFNQLFWF